MDSNQVRNWLKLETFGDPVLITLVEVCTQFMNRVEEKSEPCWLTLMGETGTGKTHCAEKLFRYVKAKSERSYGDFEPRKIYWPAMVSDLRSRNEDVSSVSFDLLRDMRDWPVVFLDDIASERDTTGFAAEQINTLLSCRVGKWTILTSNLNIGKLSGVDARLADRIIRGANQWAEVNTHSYSLRKLEAQR
jgi:DNA replication protein DnaC